MSAAKVASRIAWLLHAVGLVAAAVFTSEAHAQRNGAATNGTATNGTASAARPSSDRYDPVFRKYAKRYFGVGYDWRVFKAQGMAESDMTPTARSRVGARGIMQLMPSTYREIQSKNPELAAIDDPEWNIAAGIYYDRKLWEAWKEHPTAEDRRDFMFGSYNAGRGTILRAQRTARERQLDHFSWRSVETVAPDVTRWRYRETLGYVQKIKKNLGEMDSEGRVKKEDRRQRREARE